MTAVVLTPQPHPRVTFINAINGASESRCYPDTAAAYDAAATEQPFNNTRLRLGWCSADHAAPEEGEN